MGSGINSRLNGAPFLFVTSLYMPACALASHCSSAVSSHSSEAGGGPGINPVAASRPFVLFYYTTEPLFFTERGYNEHLSHKNAFVNIELDMTVTTICPFVVYVCLCVCTCVSCHLLCRGKGISPGWRRPALQILWEFGGKIKPSSKCQKWFRWRDTKMSHDAMIISHFSSCFPIRSRPYFPKVIF